ncbi:MAG: DUF4199 domain-containing protein [Mongoliibacter sp.]|uniref:DUF4199 domain-containing protein n=1 Tax=Mongoliibacter sp. TaxID=2022438 RepID=UPI0012F256C2|nr:DUF4199 domain-containing protein [Mongoliibacter sp.]TVP46597.1 MAG: DUF4199 domain-containing protein [Mongoliibacter sp.]
MKNLKTEIKWALIFVAMQLTWFVLEKLTGLHGENIDQHYIFTNFVAVFAFVVYALAFLDKRKNDLGGKMTYWQGLKTGLWISLFVTILTPLTQYLVSYWISPEYFPNMIAHSVEKGEMNQEEAEAYFNFENYLFQSVVFAPIAGIVTSTIVAIFTRKK